MWRHNGAKFLLEFFCPKTTRIGARIEKKKEKKVLKNKAIVISKVIKN